MFLIDIDKLYDIERRIHNIPAYPNEQFYCFIPVEPECFSSSNSFMIYKSKLSKLFIKCGKQKVYLSDIQIIETILNMHDSDQIWFLNQFIDIYNGKFKPFHFKMSSNSYVGKGMSYYENNQSLSLFSDSVIDMNDFIFIVNFVINKDIEWGKHTGRPNFYHDTLCKYISLLDFYSKNSEHSRIFLQSINYPFKIGKPIDTFKSKKNKGKLFKNIETFDISKYM